MVIAKQRDVGGLDQGMAWEGKVYAALMSIQGIEREVATKRDNGEMERVTR